MQGFFFTDDEYFQTLNIGDKIKDFILSFDKIFEERIVDEIFIVKYFEGKIIPIYFYCAHTECQLVQEITKDGAEKVKKKKMEDFQFFIDNVITKQCLINNEGIIAKDQIGGLFDAVFRYNEYYIGFNNSKNSFKELQEKLGLTEETFIKLVKKFYNSIRL